MSDNDTKTDRYDAAAVKLQAALTAAFPDCKWWVPTSTDLMMQNISGMGSVIDRGRLDVEVRRDGYGARVPCTIAFADSPEMTEHIARVAIYTMDLYRRSHEGGPEPDRSHFRELP